MKLLGKKFSEARLRYNQNRILEGYKKRCRLSTKEGQALHMFFSPYRVPKRLTKDEVKLVIQLYPLLGDYRRSAFSAAERFLDMDGRQYSASVLNVHLPDELVSAGRMTRAKFREGISKLLQLIG